jgi:hypothetical protein
MPLTAWQVPKGARTSRRKQLRKSNCRSTGGGVRAQEGQGTATGPALLPREGDAWEHVPRLGEPPIANWSLPHGGERHEGADRKSPTRNPASPQGPKPVSRLHVPRPQDGRSMGSEWCRLPGEDPLQAPRPLKDGGPGTGLDQFEGVKDRGWPAGDGPRTGCHPRVRGEHRAHFS